MKGYALRVKVKESDSYSEELTMTKEEAERLIEQHKKLMNELNTLLKYEYEILEVELEECPDCKSLNLKREVCYRCEKLRCDTMQEERE